jgi:hypothetical protein
MRCAVMFVDHRHGPMALCPFHNERIQHAGAGVSADVCWHAVISQYLLSQVLLLAQALWFSLPCDCCPTTVPNTCSQS